MMKEYMPKARKILVLYVLFPMVLDLIIESLNRKSLFSALAYVVDRPSLYFFNVLIVMLTLSMALFFQREIFVYSLISIVWALFGIANYIILHFRVTPFSAVDFTLISSAISVSGHYLSVLNIAMFFVGIVLLGFVVIALFKRAPRHQENKGKKAFILSGSIVLMIGCLLIFIKHSSTSVQALANNYTNISEAYENYGFVYCFTNSIIDTGIAKPDDYSEESVDRITQSLKNEKNTTNKPNIVMVQLESFFDTDCIKGLKFSKDPLPNFHHLQENYSDGYLTVPTVGAGTVNTEFEVLTGMSQHDFGVSEYPYKTILKSTTAESICNDLKSLGYTSHCVHNNTATFYGRNKVFSNLNFDSFTSIEYMNHLTLNPNGWCNDDIMADEIIKTLKSTKNQDFTFGITVQSHGKYDGVVDPGTQEIKVTGAPQGEESAYSYYINEVYEVDQMIGDLIQKLSALDEDTVLVLYGDHLPSLNFSKDDLSNHSLYQTEYVIWNNFGLTHQDQNLTSYQLYSTVLDQIGIHEGTITRYHQQKNWKSSAYLEGLQTLEYDLLYGENYAHQGENPYPASNLSMGTEEIKLDRVKREGEEYVLSGEGFTPYCKVKYQDKELDTTFIDETHLQFHGEIEKDPKKENDFIVEVQNGDGLLLSQSKPLSYEASSLN